MAAIPKTVIALGAMFYLSLAGSGRAGDPVTIVCLGDSVTKGARSGVKPEQTFCNLLEARLKKAGFSTRVVNAGIGGHTTADGLSRLARDVLAPKPSYAVIMFGLNDSWIDKGQKESRISVAQYAANLRKMVADLKKNRITPILMTPNPVAAPMYPHHRNARLKSYVVALRELAAAEKVLSIDVYARFGELALEEADLNRYFTDAMHPNPRGHDLIATMLEKEFQRLLKK